MSDDSAPSSSTFLTTARQQVRTALELAGRRSRESASRVAADLTSMSAAAAVLGFAPVAELARRGSEQAQILDRDPAALTACVRTLRDLGRAIEAVERSAPPPKAVAPATRARARVLVVDDSALNAMVVCDALERASFEARYAEDGDTAVAEIAKFAPDVVLTDVHMPGSTPADLCARLRTAAGGRPILVMLFSGMPDEALSQLAAETRADGFVSKDRGLEAVVAEITSASRRVAG